MFSRVLLRMVFLSLFQGSLSMDGIGPVGDHTTGSGFYLSVFRSTDQVQAVDLVATLQSPELMGMNIKCFVFWYFIWGDLSQLTVSNCHI